MSNETAIILCAILVIFFGVPVVASPFVLGGLVIVSHYLTGRPR